VLFGWGKLTHMDIMVTNTTVEVDGIQIIREGKIVHPDLV
jgi:leucyl aminopeptidase (aminopeptidase T)